MDKRKRHSEIEIAANLARANDLAKEGKFQNEIAKLLGISVMTLHRWRKDVRFQVDPVQVAAAERADTPSVVDSIAGAKLSELQIENSRLRRLVIDLLLEKLKVEEKVRGRVGSLSAARRER
jgi:putative transposase